MTHKPLSLTDRFSNILHHFTNCQYLSSLLRQIDTNETTYKIFSKQNEIQDFQQNSRRAKNVVIMNISNSIVRDLYTYLSILLATSNYRVRGMCVLARAFHARIAP